MSVRITKDCDQYDVQTVQSIANDFPQSYSFLLYPYTPTFHALLMLPPLVNEVVNLFA